MISRRTTENPCRRKTPTGNRSRTVSPGSVRSSGAAAVLSLLGIMACGIGLAESSGLDHEVRPACPPEASVCQFDFLISQQETMVWYDRPKHKGFPLVYINETFFKRLPGGGICDDLAPISDEELADVVTADGRYRTAYFINDAMPGPSIVVYEGQQVAVRVHNHLLQEGTSIHWHGIKHRGTPWMDGVAGVTQCAINPDESFTYRFRATPSGTHWYHSHYGSQRTDGLFGALVVLERPEDTTDTDRDPNRTPKDSPPASGHNEDNNGTMTSESPTTAPTPPRLPAFEKEFVLMVHDWFVETSEAILIRYLAENQR
nr:L-ascorbate oxidase [Arenicola marina]